MIGTFIWTELITADVEAAKAHYAELVGWTYEPHPMPEGGTYWVAKTGDRPCAGIMGLETLPPGETPHWFVYLASGDVDASCAILTGQGGRVNKTPWNVPGVGRLAVVSDAQGACFGLMKPE